jgi:transcription elongation factor Elf1
MSDNEDIAKGLDAICIALRDMSVRLKQPPEAVPEKKFACPACGAEHQSFQTEMMHISHKHPDWGERKSCRLSFLSIGSCVIRFSSR